MELRILGPLEALTDDGVPIDLGTPKQRAVLALLATRPGRVVPVQTLVDELWADEPPERAIASLQAYVSRLRRALEPGRAARGTATVLVSRAPGYVLAVPPEAVDAVRFAAAAGSAHGGDDPAVLGAALELWRGDPLPELGDSPLAQAERARLQELRFAAVERRAAAWLAGGRLAEVIYTTEAALAESPYRESLWAQLMLALYRSGRQAEALSAFAKARTILAGELGIEPGPDLRRLESDILRQSPGLGALGPPATVPPQPGPVAPEPVTVTVAAEPGPGAAEPGTVAAEPGTVTVAAEPGTVTVAAEPGTVAAEPGTVTVAAEPGTVAAEPGTATVTAEPDGDAEPLVGRDRELAVADEILARRGRVLVVEGVAGIGKSALLGEIARRAAGLGFAIGLGGGVDGPQPPVFLPWAQALRGLAAGWAAELAEAFAPFGNLPAVLDPALAGAIELPAPERLADAELARSRLFQGLVDGLRRLAGRRPVLLVFDDAHLLDRPSRTLLGLCLRAVPGSGLVVVLAARSGEGVTDLAAGAQAVPLRLEGLSGEDVARLGRRVAQRALGRETVSVLVDRTGGNPFFVGELLRVLLAEHALDERGARERTPARVQEVIRRRFARLPGQLGAVLAVASVLGREFDVAVLRELTQLDELELYDTLDTGLATGVLEGGADGRLRFAHDLLRQAAYEEQGPLRRARLHARAARALHERSATERAAHLRLALPVAAALEVAPVLAAAAGEAYERTAVEEAVALLEEAVGVVLSAAPSRARDVAELDLRVRLAYTHQATGDYLGAPAAAQYALMEPVLARVTPGPDLVAALWGYASFHNAAGDDGRVAAIAALDPFVAAVHAGYAAHARADLPRARALLREALDALPEGGLPVFPLIDWDPVAGILGPAASVESLLGDRAAAEALLARAGRATPFQDMYVTSYSASVAADAYDAGAVLERARRTLRLAEQTQSREYRAVAQVLAGWAGGDEALLAGGEDALGGMLWRYPRLLALRPDLLLRAGRAEEAARLARARLQTPLEGLNRFAEPDLRRVLGVATGDRAELERALAVARELGHAPAVARIGTVLA
ncbi:BTAD domain-containing putative transcriptional regulator [Dactylosporangium sp. CA-052675]|uniref:BTAD domain-containing putative transcriptional regulator n=1 Tax=Dactylosporangium sp. CA-052675 TaxID=3239927 RepID=UPI003D8FED64